MAHVIIIGAGAIGSHLMPHVARTPGVTAVSVVDHDAYTASNLASQQIGPADVGKSKAEVQVRRLRQLNRWIVATAVPRAVEDLPLGWLRGDVILACLDSRRARLVVNQAAWRLGVPWINAGVDAGGLLARVQVFGPGPDAACLECAWDTRDYELVEQAYPCQAGAAAAPTAAPAALGGLAASLVAIECEKVLAGRWSEALVGRDVLIDARHHRHYVTAFARNAMCRMPDHAGWTFVPARPHPRETALRDLVALGDASGGGGPLRLGVAGQRFALAMTCATCRRRSPITRLARDLRASRRRCRSCGGALAVTGFDLRDSLRVDALPAATHTQPLAALGLMAGDVVMLKTTTHEVHVELGGRHV